MSRCTTFARSLIKTAVMLGSIALGTVAPALAVSGPMQVLYIFPGVTDTGGASRTGVATAVHCFSFSPNQETIQYVVRDFQGAQATNAQSIVNQFQTVTAVTRISALYSEDISFSVGVIDQGVLGISATSTNIVCTAHIIDASATVPNGIDLHGTRFNPISGSQE
jgi:hypothetical protein